MKTSVISPEFRDRYLVNPNDPNAFEGKAVVFDGPEDYHHRIDDPALGIDEHTILFMRGAGPIGYPGAAEVVNMRAPDYLIKQGVTSLACIGDGRQSGTSGSPSILNASPEAAAGGNLAVLKTGDRVRIDLGRGTANILISDDELGRAPRGAEGRGRLQVSRAPDPLAGDPAHAGRSDGDRRGAGERRPVPAPRADEGRAPRQPLRPPAMQDPQNGATGAVEAAPLHILDAPPAISAKVRPTIRQATRPGGSTSSAPPLREVVGEPRGSRPRVATDGEPALHGRRPERRSSRPRTASMCATSPPGG